MDGLNVPLETSTYQEMVYAIMDDQYNLSDQDTIAASPEG